MERILVVDDEKGILFGLRQYFAQQGYTVDTATSSDEALEQLAANQYGLAIIDVELRGNGSSDGLNLAEFIRRHAPATVVIVLTAHESPEAHQRAREVGVHSFLSKPARLSLLADLAGRLMRAGAVAAVLR